MSLHEASDLRSNWVERALFPRSPWINFLIIAIISFVFSFALTGPQIFKANWGLIDDHEVFYFLGSGLQVAPGDIWQTMLANVHMDQGRFRPTYYLIKMAQTSFWGTNVHIWYLSLTVGFALLLSSIWWTLRRALGGWLSGVLTAAIALLPLWADVWSRLGPSENYGAACLGIMIYAADFVLFSDSRRIRALSATILALATIALLGLKETFLPLAAFGLAVVLLAYSRKQLSPVLTAVLAASILLSLGSMAYIVGKLTSSGSDYYGKPVGLWPLIKFTFMGLFDGTARTAWLFIFPFMLLRLLRVIPRKPIKDWISESRTAIGAYAFLLMMYAAQCGFYRSSFPYHMRYDFPAMLLVPMTCCILAYEVSRRLRAVHTERTIEYVQLIVAGFLVFALAIVYAGRPAALPAAVEKNIKTTNLFYDELQRIVRAAKLSSKAPLILDAHGPLAYEGVFALSSYLPSLGVENPISVRFHRSKKTGGDFLDSL